MEIIFCLGFYFIRTLDFALNKSIEDICKNRELCWKYYVFVSYLLEIWHKKSCLIILTLSQYPGTKLYLHLSFIELYCCHQTQNYIMKMHYSIWCVWYETDPISKRLQPVDTFFFFHFILQLFQKKLEELPARCDHWKPHKGYVSLLLVLFIRVWSMWKFWPSPISI